MSSELSSQTPQASTPHCFRHPNRETWLRCTRCDRPICPDCMRPAAVGFQCPECVASGRATTRTPTARFGGKVVTGGPVVTYALIAANAIMFIITAVTSPLGPGNNRASDTFFRLVLSPSKVAVHGEYWRMIGSAFLHNGWLHLIVNMFALWVVGPSLESIFGRWRFLTVYFVAAFGGSVAVYLFDNEINSTAGASGAIFGLFGATVIVFRKMRMDSRAILGVIAVNLVITFTIPNISWLGHLGGLVLGVVTAAAIIYAPEGRYRSATQAVGVGLLVAALVGLTAYRTSVIRDDLIVTVPSPSAQGGEPGEHVPGIGAQGPPAEQQDGFADVDLQGPAAQAEAGALVDSYRGDL